MSAGLALVVEERAEFSVDVRTEENGLRIGTKMERNTLITADSFDECVLNAEIVLQAVPPYQPPEIERSLLNCRTDQRTRGVSMTSAPWLERLVAICMS